MLPVAAPPFACESKIRCHWNGANERAAANMRLLHFFLLFLLLLSSITALLYAKKSKIEMAMGEEGAMTVSRKRAHTGHHLCQARIHGLKTTQ
jgi:hypothetical protein